MPQGIPALPTKVHARRALGLVLGLAALGMAGAGQASAATLRADYRFQESRASSVGTAPPLTDVTGSGSANSFGSESVDGAQRNVLRFPARNGLSLPTTGVVSSGSYSFVLLFNLDNVGFFKKLIDFRNGMNDSGLYSLGGGSAGPGEGAFYSKTSGDIFSAQTENPPIRRDDYVQLAMTREASGLVRVYIEGVQQFTFTDRFSEAMVGPAGNVRFFVDDSDTGGSEASSGAVSRIRAYDGALTPAEVAALSRAPQPAGCASPGAVVGTDAGEILNGSPTDDDLVCAGGGNDTVGTSGGDDRILGEGGNDVLDGGAGADSLSGGEGVDRVSYNGRVSPLTVSIGAGSGDDGASGEGDSVEADVEDLRGGSGNDTLTGDDDPNLLLGEGGNDIVSGGGGADDLRGDSSNAQDGADIVNGGSGNDALRGYAGNDRHSADGGNDTIYSDADSDTISGGDGVDGAYYAGRTDAVIVTVGSGAGDDGAAGEADTVAGDVEKVSGGSAADRLTGDQNPLGTVLLGGAGDDILDGGGGPKDLLSGEEGSDDLLAADGDSSDTLSCGGGPDTFAADLGDLIRDDCEPPAVASPTAAGGARLRAAK